MTEEEKGLVRKLPVQKQQYLRMRMLGENKLKSALAAGYSQKTARNMHVLEDDDYKAAFQALVRKRIPPNKISKRIAEGMDAVNTEFFAKDGIVTDSRDTVNWKERREYTALAAQMGNYWTPKQDVDVTQRLDPAQASRLIEIAEELNLSRKIIDAEEVQKANSLYDRAIVGKKDNGDK